MASTVQRKKNRKKNFMYMLFLLPGLLYLLVNNYIPMFGVFIAFKDIDYVKGIFSWMSNSCHSPTMSSFSGKRKDNLGS